MGRATAEIAAAGQESTERQASRVGKWNCSAWLDPKYRSSMKRIQIIHPGITQQEIIEEALDLVIAKYGAEARPVQSRRRLFSFGR